MILEPIIKMRKKLKRSWKRMKVKVKMLKNRTIRKRKELISQKPQKRILKKSKLKNKKK